MVDTVTPNSSESKSIVADCSYLLFVYPFLFEPESFEVRVKGFDTAEFAAGHHTHKVWNKDKFPGGDMLTSVANYLNPPETEHATARLWKMNWALRDRFGFSDRAEWKLLLGNKEIPFTLGRPLENGKKETSGSFAFKLAMFQVGVGFLSVCITPGTAALDDWLDFAHYFRFINRRKEVAISAKASSMNRIYNSGEPLFPETNGESRADSGENGKKFVFNSVVETLLNTGVVAVDKRPDWWSEVFVPEQALPFAAIFVDGEQPSNDLLLAHKLQNFFHSRQTVIPANFDLDPSHSSLLPYAERQWFVFSLDGGAFLAGDAPDNTFFRQTLPDHIRDHYFLLYLLTLHQRFFLMSLQQRITQQWVNASAAGRLASFEAIRESLLEFTARSIFPQIMQREHHHRCYRKWQEVFQIDELYREVRTEVRDMHEYSLFKLTEREERSARRIETMLAVLGLPAILLGFLGVNMIGYTTANDGLRLSSVLVMAAIFAAAGAAVVWFLRRSDR